LRDGRDGILSRRHQNPADRHYSRQPEERPRRIAGQRCPLHPWSHCDSPANGLTFCVGSYGARPDNDLLAMIDEFAPRIHFAHLRQVVREADGSFYEAEHLRGSSDMVGVIRALLHEKSRRRRGPATRSSNPYAARSWTLTRRRHQQKTNPGYSYIGRLKGLAELRGVMEGLRYANSEFEDGAFARTIAVRSGSCRFQIATGRGRLLKAFRSKVKEGWRVPATSRTRLRQKRAIFRE
jgi:hypothetical protein